MVDFVTNSSELSNENLFEKDERTLLKELLEECNLSEPLLIGQYTEITGKNFGFFKNIKTEDGRTINYPFNFGVINNIFTILSLNNILEHQKYYKFSFCLSSKNQRLKKNNPYLVQVNHKLAITEINWQKNWVDNIFKSTGTTENDASLIASSLKNLAGDLYTETERFIFEIIQNADDLPNKSGKVKIQFVFLKEHLVIIHNGKPFNDQDVKAISNIGRSTKEEDTSKTGYKGIGFKSVFIDSECVYVYSGQYSFRYDKNYYKNPEEIPWQIKPIWTEKEDLPQEILTCHDFFRSPVAIGLKVGVQKINEYKIKIRELFSEARFMLFLRHISEISVSGINPGLSISLKLEKFNGYSQILYNEKLKSKWLVKDIEFDVAAEIKNKIQNDSLVPKKLQGAEKTKLVFAAKIENDELIALPPEQSILFTYLPTNVNDYNFPFLVNADFLTTANREDLHKDNDWNGFIFENIAYHFFKFLQWITTEHKLYQKNIAELIPSELERPGKIGKYFKEGFDRALKEIAFLPSEDTNELLKVSEAIIDEIGITKIISPQIIKNILMINQEFVSREVNNQRNFKKLGVESFDFIKLCKLLNSENFWKNVSLETYIELLICLENQAEFLAKEQVSIIINEQKEYIYSSSEHPVYFQPSAEDKVLLTFDSFNFLEPAIDVCSLDNPNLRNILKKLGVKEFKALEIIRERILKRKHGVKDNLLNGFVNYIRLLFKYKYELTNNDYSGLSELFLVYKEDEKYYHVVASECYLSDFYKPIYPLENLAKVINTNQFKFIISGYCEPENDIEEWQEFFIKIGIIKPNGLYIIRHFIVPLIQQNKINDNNNLPIIQFIFSVFGSSPITEQDLKNELNKLPLLTTHGLKPAQECFLSKFYDSGNKITDFLKYFSIPNLVSSDYCRENQTVESWRQFLINIGVKELKGIELIREKIRLLGKNPDLVNQNNAVEVVREIFNIRSQLTEEDYKHLLSLKILLKNGDLAPAYQCYLSKEYEPKQDLENLFSSTDFEWFVSPDYLKTGETYQDWKEFLKNLGIEEKIKIQYITKAKITFSDVYENYLKFIGKWGLINKNNKYDVENFTDVQYFEKYCHNYYFAFKIWSYLIKEWDKLTLSATANIWINNQCHTVDSYFKYVVTHYSSIPCSDKVCRTPSEVYSISLNSHLMNCKLPVAALNFTAKMEQFIGLKRTLDIPACLKIIDRIASDYSPERDDKTIDLIYQELEKIYKRGLSVSEKNFINEWKQKGQLPASDDSLHLVSELHYIDSELHLPYKRSSKLVKFPDTSKNISNFDTVFSMLDVNKLTKQEISVHYEYGEKCTILLSLIQDRLNYLSIYLCKSTNDDLVNSQEEKIRSALEQIEIIKADTLFYYCQIIDYKEHIYNYYVSVNNTHYIYYVGVWNSRKNSNLGNYLIEALKLDQEKITGEKLLDFLDDPIEEIRDYLRACGFDVTDYPDTKTIVTTTHIGTGVNPENWGQFGEEKAKKFYEKLGYIVTKQPNNVGYDFRCVKSVNNNIIYSEVKTISYSNEAIRITSNEWRVMCSPEHQQDYELLIIIHEGRKINKCIRIHSAWITIQQVLTHLSGQQLSDVQYGSNNLEPLLSFQRSSTGNSNDIILNWLRLFLNGPILSSIEKLSQEDFMT